MRQPRKTTSLRVSDRVMAYCGCPKAVSPSTNAYWKERGITPSMNTRIPQTLRSAISAFEVNSETKGPAANRETTVIVVVNSRHSPTMYFSAFLMSAVFFAP